MKTKKWLVFYLKSMSVLVILLPLWIELDYIPNDKNLNIYKYLCLEHVQGRYALTHTSRSVVFQLSNSSRFSIEFTLNKSCWNLNYNSYWLKTAPARLHYQSTHIGVKKTERPSLCNV